MWYPGFDAVFDRHNRCRAARWDGDWELGVHNLAGRNEQTDQNIGHILKAAVQANLRMGAEPVAKDGGVHDDHRDRVIIPNLNNFHARISRKNLHVPEPTVSRDR